MWLTGFIVGDDWFDFDHRVVGGEPREKGLIDEISDKDRGERIAEPVEGCNGRSSSNL